MKVLRVPGSRLDCLRRISSKAFDASGTLPFIERPAVTDAIQNCLSQRGPSISWIQGGLGCGKSESIYRTLNKIEKDLKKSGDVVFVIDFENFKKGEVSQTDSLARSVTREVAAQLARQIGPNAVYKLLHESDGTNFQTSFTRFAKSKPLWAHFLTTSRSLDDMWRRIMTNQSALEDLLPSMPLSGGDGISELESWLKVLMKCSRNVSFVLLHVERSNCNILRNDKVFSMLIDPKSRFNVLIECNDALKSIWNICEESELQNNKSIIEVGDLPKEAIQAVFVPSLLSDEVHVKAVYSICGGRIGLLQKLVSPLNKLTEEQKLLDQEQEQLYRNGKENRPSSESRELQINPLVHKREVLVRDALISGVFKQEVDDFHSSMQRTLSDFAPIAELRKSMNEVELHVLFCESIRAIACTLSKSGSLALPSGVSLLDISHPVVLGLLGENVLSVAWLPYPRIVAQSSLKLFLIESWYAAEMEAMPLTSRPYYNLVSMRNKNHIEKQIEKLVR